MAIDKRTAFLMAYIEREFFIPFLSTFFTTTPSDIVNAESVIIEIQRNTRKIAPVISDLTARGSIIKKSIYTQKEFKPPVVSLGSVFTAGDLIEKVFGMTQYDSAGLDYLAQLQIKIMETMAEIESQIMRSIEFQSSQIFQNKAIVVLYDDKGQPAYEIDFKAKDEHFPVVDVNWSDETSDPDIDIANLSKVITKNGRARIRNLVFGENAYNEYFRNTKIQDKLNIRRIVSGELDPREVNPDVNYIGNYLIGNRRYNIWQYEGEYEHPETKELTPFVDPDKVIFLPDAGAMNVDFRRIFCTVPSITGTDPRFSELIPMRMNLDNRSYLARVWEEKGADTLNMELKTRPLDIPVSIDSFGCLTTNSGE